MNKIQYISHTIINSSYIIYYSFLIRLLISIIFYNLINTEYLFCMKNDEEGQLSNTSSLNDENCANLNLSPNVTREHLVQLERKHRELENEIGEARNWLRISQENLHKKEQAYAELSETYQRLFHDHYKLQEAYTKLEKDHEFLNSVNTCLGAMLKREQEEKLELHHNYNLLINQNRTLTQEILSLLQENTAIREHLEKRL